MAHKEKQVQLDLLLKEVLACTHCSPHLPLGPRPVVRAHTRAAILVIGQAPGTRVHESGIPWNDPSGVRLRHWLKKNPWFESEVVPHLRARVRALIKT